MLKVYLSCNTAEFASFWRLTPTVCTCHILLILLLVCGRLGRFYVLAIVNEVAMTMDVPVSPLASVLNSFGCILRNGIAESYGRSILIFWGTSILFSTEAVPFYSHQQYKKVSVFPHPCNTCLLLLFLITWLCFSEELSFYKNLTGKHRTLHHTAFPPPVCSLLSILC